MSPFVWCLRDTQGSAWTDLFSRGPQGRTSRQFVSSVGCRSEQWKKHLRQCLCLDQIPVFAWTTGAFPERAHDMSLVKVHRHCVDTFRCMRDDCSKGQSYTSSRYYNRMSAAKYASLTTAAQMLMHSAFCGLAHQEGLRSTPVVKPVQSLSAH